MNEHLEYFAAKDKFQLAADLESKITAWSEGISSSGLKDRWIKSYRYYYGRQFGGRSFAGDSGISEAGESGELKLVTVNHYRNLLKHIHILTTNQKPAFDVRAINSDLKSLQQAKLANNILDAYLREKRLARYLKNAAEHALVFGKGFVYVTWDTTLGNPHTVKDVENQSGTVTQQIQYEGDVLVRTPSVFDVYNDQTSEDFSKIEWVVIREWKNKFNLAIRYPEEQDKILSLKTKSEMEKSIKMSFQDLDETSDVPVYAFYHKRTDALPNGRFVLFCDNETVLYDGPIPYDGLPIYRIVPGEIFGTTEGYTDGFDLLGLQEVVNTLVSSVFSNQSAFAIQNILLPEGCNVTEEQIGQGLRAIRYNPQAGVPSALQLTNSPPEVFELIKLIVSTMETVSGVNAVSRGNPEASMGKGSSGAALALIQSMAVQYMSGFQQSWAELLEDTGTSILKLLKAFAKTDRMIAMAGKVNRGAMQSFSGSDLDRVERVVVDVGNPMSKTTAGKVSMAENLLDKGMVKTPQEYINVMNTGTLDPLTEAPQAELDLVRQENERMMDGSQVQAIVGDSHVLHMQEHKALLANPEVRLNSPIAAQVVAHIQEHMNLYKTQDPMWSMISGEPPPPPGPPMPPPPPGPPGMSVSSNPSGPPGNGGGGPPLIPQEMSPQDAPNPAGVIPAQPPQVA